MSFSCFASVRSSPLFLFPVLSLAAAWSGCGGQGEPAPAEALRPGSHGEPRASRWRRGGTLARMVKLDPWYETRTERAVEVDPGAGPAARARLSLVVRVGDRLTIVDVEDHGDITIGRAAETTIVVEDACVSRVHARIRRRGSALLVADLASRNGTWVNAELLRGAARVASGGDVIRIGPAEIFVAAVPDGEGPAPEPGAARIAGDAVVADPAMVSVLRVAERLAGFLTIVLLTGETGSGKGVVAEHIHRSGPRAGGPFVSVNCAAVPEGLLEAELFGYERGAFTGATGRKAGYFEAAHGGTLLLDEAGDLPLGVQARLLRALDSRRVTRLGSTSDMPVDVRILCATHKDLVREVEAGRFREDLYYRLSGFTLSVPPLRARPAEILLLARRFAAQLAASANLEPPSFAGDALAALAAHRWPGNVRELKNAIEHAIVLAEDGVVRASHLPAAVRQRPTAVPLPAAPAPIRDRIAEIERRTLEDALAAHGGNQTRTAKTLGLSRRALLYKMAKHRIKKRS